jgi:3-dehydroshikimate dehydratase
MKTCFCTIAFQKNKWGRDRKAEKPLTEILPILAECDFDGVEIWGEHLLSLDQQDLDVVQRQLEEYKLEVAMVSPYFDFTTSDESADTCMNHAGQVLEHARKLKSRAIRVFTGKTGSANATTAQWERAVRCLQQLADQSNDDRVLWACETHPNNLMDDVESSLRLMREVNRENVRLIFQPSTFGEDYLRALDLLGPFICHVHATNHKDDQRTALDGGDMDYRGIVAGLRRFSFEGFISVEWMGDDPETMARREGPYLRKLVE